LASALQTYMAERAAGLERTKQLRSMNQSQVVQHLLEAQPELKAKGYSVNLEKYLGQQGVSSNPNVQVLRAGAQNLSDVAIAKPIDVSQIIDSSWMRPIKQTALRASLAAQTQSIKQRQTKFANVWSDLGSTPQIELPLAAESPVKQNDVLPPSEKPYEEIPPVNSGRIELSPNVSEPSVQEPDWIKEMHEKAESSTPVKSDNSKYFIIGGIALAAIVLFLILRRRK
jgi:LPXTG-motif cell wall-anchored protein